MALPASTVGAVMVQETSSAESAPKLCHFVSAVMFCPSSPKILVARLFHAAATFGACVAIPDREFIAHALWAKAAVFGAEAGDNVCNDAAYSEGLNRAAMTAHDRRNALAEEAGTFVAIALIATLRAAE